MLDEARRRSMPGSVACKICGRSFEPAWKDYRGLWHYPGFEPGLQTCERCIMLQQIKSDIEAFLRRAGVPPKYIPCTFENFQVGRENTRAYSLCKDYIGDPSEGLFIYGGWGVGKTHLAAAIARELVLTGRDVVFISVPKMLIEIRDSFKDNARQTEAACLEGYLSCKFLILDDFGIEKTTAWSRQTLDFIVYERDSHLKPTIITSNLSLDEISEHVDRRISSRLAGMGSVVRVGGPDFRTTSLHHAGASASTARKKGTHLPETAAETAAAR